MPKNILHIFTDQQRFDTINVLGNKLIKTPNMDRIAKEGVAFTNAYTPSPVCVAARCSMIYGQYPINTGSWGNDNMPSNGITFMQVLSKAGYKTQGIGKCHFTPDSNALRGFQNRLRQEELNPEELSKEPYYMEIVKEGYSYAYEAHGVRSEMYYIPQPSRLPAHLHPTAWIGKQTSAFINKQANSAQPWYCFASFIHPHPPFAPPVPWHNLYRAVDMPLPNIPEDVYSIQTFINHMQNRYKYRDYGWDNNLLRCIKAYYYACISFIDYQIGLILTALESTGQLDNTLILFSSDHGEHLGDYMSFGKRTMQDSSARIPLLVRLPGVFEGGERYTIPVSLIDLFPTFLETAGLSYEKYFLDGTSLFTLVEQKNNSRTLYSMYSAYNDISYSGIENIPKEYYGIEKQGIANYMAVNERWKYIWSVPDQKEIFFDRENDSLEQYNQSNNKIYEKEKSLMKNKLISFLNQHNITEIINNKTWKYLPPIQIPSNPNIGLLRQDISADWYSSILLNYQDFK